MTRALFGQSKESRLVEFFRTVNGEAKAWAAQRIHQHGNLGGIRPEMGVHVVCRRFAQPS
jgi:hypothetical protein